MPAIWNVAAAAKRRVGVFGLWATFPAEKLGEGDVVVSDRLFAFQHQQSAPPEGFVSPPERAEWARAALVRAEGEVDCRRLREFVPDTSEAECETARTDRDPYARPISGLRRILVETQVYDELARSWIESESPDLAIVYIQGTDAIGHVLGRFFPPRLPSTEERDFARFSEVPGRYFEEIDRLLGRYRALAEKLGARLVVASDHGFTWSAGRPEGLSSLAVATAAKWHRKDGIYLVWGEDSGPRALKRKDLGERAPASPASQRPSRHCSIFRPA